jgi:alpha-D-xyloside xylohydrolase
MKFSQGAWRWAEGVSPAVMRRVHHHRVEGGTLFLCLVDRHGTQGVDTFEGTILELRISSPMPDAIRVHTRHHHPAEVGHHRFDLDYALTADGVKIDASNDEIVYTSGRLTLRVRLTGSLSMRFEDETGQLITSSAELGYMTVAGETPPPLSNGRLRDGLRPGHHLMQRLTLDVDEQIYGLGERFGPLVKNGQSVAIWNEDGGTMSELAYKNVPFYLSSRGYGLLVNHPGQAEFEIATERVSQLQFSVPGEELDYYVFLGPDPKQVLDHYTRLSGRPAKLPAWSFGLWLSTSFTTKYDESTVNEFVDGMISRGIPLSVFHFDCFWMKQRHWCDFEWNRDAFPDPVGMLKRLKDKGLKICVWINPYISQLSPLFEEGREHGYFLKSADGSVYQRDAWQPGMALVDFTNPSAVAWYQRKLRGLLEMGVDSFKTDFGELIPVDVVYHDRSDPQRMHNFYAYLYNKCVFDLLESFHGQGNALVFARSATVGSQKFPVHWGGDCSATFSAMAEDLRGGLSFCSSGPAFWSHDIGGFEGTSNAANYKRWVAFGLLSTHSRLHGSSSYRVPWLFDNNLAEGEPSAVDVMRHFTRLKLRVYPYLAAAALDAHEFGWPVMRTMFIEFPDDPACRYLDKQYMLGPSLLVAPIFRDDGTCEYYVPKGTWIDLQNSRPVQGGSWRKERFDFFNLPLLLREDSMIPMTGNHDRPGWIVSDELTLHIGHLTENAVCALRVVSDEGSTIAFSMRRAGHTVRIESDALDGSVNILLRARQGVIRANHGRALRERPEGLQIEWTDLSTPLTFELTD